MKNKTIVLVILSVCLTPCVMAANAHFVDYHVGLGYARQCNNISDSRTPGGVGFDLGVSYEYNINKWILMAGLEFEFMNSTTKLDKYTQTNQYYYLPRAEYILQYPSDFSNVRREENVGFVHVPLRFGYQFTPMFYGLIGLKIGAGVFAKDKTTWDEYTYMVDPELIGELDGATPGELHNVGHRTGTSSGSAKTSWSVGFNLAPTIELGMTIKENYRLGVFAEYGVVDISQDEVFADKVNPLYVGVRFTGRIPLPMKEPKPIVEEPIVEKPVVEPEPEPEPVVEPEPEVIIFHDQEIKVDKPIILENLMFVFDQSTIIPESMASLNNLLQLLTERTDLKVHITGHTDAKGSDEYNMRLSLDRAKAVCDYLIQHGVAQDRLTYDGRGAREPIDTNATELGRQHNRRVEFTIVK